MQDTSYIQDRCELNRLDPISSHIEKERAYLQELWCKVTESQAVIENGRQTIKKSQELLKQLNFGPMLD